MKEGEAKNLRIMFMSRYSWYSVFFLNLLKSVCLQKYGNPDIKQKDCYFISDNGANYKRFQG